MDYADSKKTKNITWNAPKKADRPKTKPKSLKDLISATMSRHGIERQVSAGMIVERLNTYIREQAPELAPHVRVISVKFGAVKIGLTHRLYQEKVRPHEVALREIASEIINTPITFQYVLVLAQDMI